MLCDKCGALNEDAATVCAKCNSDLTTTEEVNVMTDEIDAANDVVTEEGYVSEGTPITEEFVYSEDVIEEGLPPKQSILKKWWLWLIVVVFALILGIVVISCTNSGSSGGSSYSAPVVNPYVRMVKDATNSNYGITYGAAFNNFFSSPHWSHFTSTEGLQVVEFEGGFSYSGSPAKAKFQFVVDVEEGTLQIYHLSINGEAQNKLMLATFVKKVFESY